MIRRFLSRSKRHRRKCEGELRSRGRFWREKGDPPHLDGAEPLPGRLGNAVQLFWSGGEIDGQDHLRESQRGDGQDRQAAGLHQAEQPLRRPGEQAPAGGPQDGPVVGDQPPSLAKQAEGEAALARTRGASDQDAPPAALQPAGDHGGVDHGGGGQARISGSTTVKRAPCTRPSAPARFSAAMRPPWASTIWRAMERPRPEWPPKAAPFGRAV